MCELIGVQFEMRHVTRELDHVKSNLKFVTRFSPNVSFFVSLCKAI